MLDFIKKNSLERQKYILASLKSFKLFITRKTIAYLTPARFSKSINL